jgi:hypothetical protein
MVRLTDGHDLDKSENWIALVRSRLALRRAEKPATKAGQIRAVWPEIEAALAGGQSMKSIRRWLEEDAGITLGLTSLTSYISRLRRRQASNWRIGASSEDSVRAQREVEPVLPPLLARARSRLRRMQNRRLNRRKTRSHRPCALYRNRVSISARVMETEIRKARISFEKRRHIDGKKQFERKRYWQHQPAHDSPRATG